MPQDARTLMIDAAERLAAERGLAALTVQAVQEAAGQRNKSAGQYHFGGRQGLVNALVAARMAPTNDQRTAMLLALDAEPSTRELVEVLVVPLIESVLRREPSYWARFLVQAIGDPGTGLAAMEAVDDEPLRITQTRLEARLGHLPAATRWVRVQSVFGYACVVLAAYEVGALPSDLTGDALTAEVIDACCGLVEAPTTARNTTTTPAVTTSETRP
ncbi:MAG TPA: helix-turn-helix domain-containing protein [Acidimicrobiales bacterium]|nr:helix-turn-helix domain-containing protein [Acidimicrobiales bacterium]